MFKWGSRARPDRAEVGASGEAAALAHLQAAGLRLLERNYRVAAGPSRRAGEVDLILREPDGTLVFVEVRARAGTSHGAAASVTAAKQARLIYAAQHYLLRHPTPPPCRFDVVAIDGGELAWLKAAFEGG
jgi:putative endonuclease